MAEKQLIEKCVTLDDVELGAGLLEQKRTFSVQIGNNPKKLVFTLHFIHYEQSDSDNICLIGELSCADWETQADLIGRVSITIQPSMTTLQPVPEYQKSIYLGGGEFNLVKFMYDGRDGYSRSDTCTIQMVIAPSVAPPNDLIAYDIGLRLFSQINEAPDPAYYTTHPGSRFVLRSNEGHPFYVHAVMLENACPVFKEWLLENRDGVRDGVPLSIDCSTKALSCMLQLIYTQKEDVEFGSCVVELLPVCHTWSMESVLNSIGLFIRRCHTEHYVDFALLLSWFASVSVRLNDSELQSILLKQLTLLAGNDPVKMEVVRGSIPASRIQEC